MAKKYLDDNGLLYLWGKIKEKFALKTHTHTKSEITDFPTTMPPTSHTHGNITNTGTLQTTDVAIANGDKLVITDSSNSSKVARASLSFDGATTTKALTKKGTWETFLTSADVPEGASASTTTPKELGAGNHPDGFVGEETAFARGDHVHPLSPVFTGSSTTADGKVGLVPAPSKIATNASTKILTEWGTWNPMLITYTASTRKLSIGFDGNDSVESVTLPLASTSAGGLMSSTEKTKLNGIEAGAEANVLEGVQMNGTDLTITSKKVNIPVFTGATTSAAGTAGLVPAPTQIQTGEHANQKFLSANGSFVDASSGFYVTDDGALTYYAFGKTYTQALPSASATAPYSNNGLMSIADKSKLDSISVTNGIIDSSCLPSFVDDVIEAYARTNQSELGSTWLATGSATGTVITPEAGKIYVLMNSSTNYEQNTQFRWGGTAYVQLNDSGCTAITNAEIDTIVAS